MADKKNVDVNEGKDIFDTALDWAEAHPATSATAATALVGGLVGRQAFRGMSKLHGGNKGPAGRAGFLYGAIPSGVAMYGATSLPTKQPRKKK